MKTYVLCMARFEECNKVTPAGTETVKRESWKTELENILWKLFMQG